MEIKQIRGHRLRPGMTMMLDPNTTAVVRDVTPVMDGRVIWVELSNGNAGGIEPKEWVDIVVGK